MAAPIARVRPRRAARRVEEFSVAKTRRISSNIDTSPFRHPTAPIPAGDKFGPYMVFEQLGEGGMAYVHRAELVGAEGFRKSVALKRMKTVTSENPDFVTSFINEGQLVGKLRHPNIAQAFELGKIGGTYYIAMEFVPGPTLAQIMAQSRRCAGAIPLPIILELLIQLCDALDHAHDLRDDGGKHLGLVHRDISPMNVIVSRAGMAKLIDFGIAKARGSSVVTQAGVIKGKHAYVAPEYTLGTGLDRRVDLWGLGVVAHEMITGRRLFLGDTEAETIRNVRSMAINPPSRIANGISAELDDIVMTALERDPAKRWQSAAAMRTALTEEARRSENAQRRANVSGAQIRDWVEWAFRQPTREDSPIGHLLGDLEPSISIQMQDLEPISEPNLDISGEINTDDLPTVDAKRPPAYQPPTRPSSKIVVDLHSRATPRFETKIPSLGFAPRARIATGTVPPDDEPRLTPPSAAAAAAAAAKPTRLGSVPEPIAPEVSVPMIRPVQLPRVATPPPLPRPDSPAPRALTPDDERPTPPLRKRPRSTTPAPIARAESPWTDALARAHAGLPREITRATPMARRATPEPLPVNAVTPRRPSTLALGRPSAQAIPKPVVPSGTAKVRPLRAYNDRPLGVPAPARKPRWNPPTRWTREKKPSQLPQLFVFLLLAGFAAMAVQLGWIDIERWREIFDQLLG